MGQPVVVTQTRSALPGVVRLEANRTLTGQGHELFRSLDDAIGSRAAAKLARELLSTGKIDQVHVYGNMVTLDLAKGHSADGLSDVLRDLHQYWKPGMVPPAFDEPAPEEPAADAAGGVADAAAAPSGGAASAYEQQVPQVLRERSAAALAKWRTQHG